MNEKQIVFVVDDDQDMLRLIAAALAQEGWPVRTFCDAAGFLSTYEPGERGCMLLDVKLNGPSGLDLQKEMQTRAIRLPIIFLTATADVSTAVKAMKCGALDLLQKPFDVQSLIATVRRAMCEDLAQSNLNNRYAVLLQRRGRLTPRELQVMELVVEGSSNKQMAATLDCSPKTIEIHRSRVMRKMEAESLAELVRQSIEFEENQRGESQKSTAGA